MSHPKHDLEGITRSRNPDQRVYALVLEQMCS